MPQRFPKLKSGISEFDKCGTGASLSYAKIVKANFAETGIRPDVPYWWQAGMHEPEVATGRLQLRPL